MKKFILWQGLLAVAVVFGLAACADRQDNANNMKTRTYGTDQNWTGNRWGANGDGMNAYGGHYNTRLEMSQQLVDQIAAMDGVRSANVMLTDNNAYVAVQMERNGQNAGNAGTMGTAGATNGRGNNRTATGTTNGGATGTTGGQDDVSQSLKQQIVDKVRSTSGANIQNVFVSANPDFVQRMNNYAQDVRQGRPLAGLVQEFNTLVQRIFPTTQGLNDRTGTTGATMDDTNRLAPGTATGRPTEPGDGSTNGIRAGGAQKTGPR